MARLAPTRNTLRALFARSGNQCAFEGCPNPLFTTRHLFVAQVCHIASAEAGGQRYDPAMSDEERRSYENLLVLCYDHHTVTNNVDQYPTERLREMKESHEATFEKSNFKIDESALYELAHEMEGFWAQLRDANTTGHELAEAGLAMEVDVERSFEAVLRSARDAVGAIEYLWGEMKASDENASEDLAALLERLEIDPDVVDKVPYYENPFVSRNWEQHNLGRPNWLNRLHLDLLHIEVKYLEEFIKTNSGDVAARRKLDLAKATLTDAARTTAHSD